MCVKPTGGAPNPAAKNQVHFDGNVGVGVLNFEALGCFESRFFMFMETNHKNLVDFEE